MMKTRGDQPGRVARSAPRARSLRLFAVVAGLLAAAVLPSPASAQTYTATRSLVPTADAHVDAKNPNTRWGTSTQLRLLASPENRAYLRFAVPALDGPVIRARLRLTSKTASSGVVHARTVGGDWVESTISYRNSPPLGANPLAASSGLLATTTELDVTPLVLASSMLNIGLTTSSTAGLAFASREGVIKPELVIETEVPGPPPEPQTTITGGPASTYRSGVGQFTFTSSAVGATFECRLDAAAFAPCTSPHPVHTANGAHSFEVRSSAGGVPDSSPARRTWRADALLQNGTFETGVDGWAQQSPKFPGWGVYKATIVAEPGGIVGNKARVTALPDATGFSIYNSPYSVNSTTAGRVYKATGYVRSATPGDRVCLEVIERSKTAQVGKASSCVTASASWEAFPAVSRTAAGNGNELYTVVTQDVATTGDSFELDGLELDDGSPLSVTQPAATPAGDPIMLAVSDIASCWSSGDEAVARLVDTQPGIVAIAGDTEQNNGSAAEFRGCYEPTWGRHKSRSRPAVGDHEYRQAGAVPYWNYFGAAAGTAGQGWYSYDLGSWHVVVLNSNCGFVGGCGPGSPQYDWLQRDLAANAKSCTAAYFHHPLFSAGTLHGGLDHVRPFWNLLYQHGAEFVFGGNDHTYQRFAPQRPDGTLDRAQGIRQFVVGTGGTELYPLGPPQANTEVQDNSAFGVLRLTLRAGGYAWKFLPQSGRSFTDEGETACSTTTPPPDTTPPAVTMTSPDDGATVSGDTKLAATVTDEGTVARVDFLVGGSLVESDTTAPYETTWATTAETNGPVEVTVRAADLAGNEASATRTVTVQNGTGTGGTETLANGDFETSLSGWGTYNSTAERVSGGATGAWSARVSYARGTYYTYETTAVAATTPGVTYTARAWLRSPLGRRVCLRIRERVDGIAYGPSTCITGSSAWQQTAAVSYVSRGGGALDVYAFQDSAGAVGDSFDLDGVSLKAG